MIYSIGKILTSLLCVCGVMSFVFSTDALSEQACYNEEKSIYQFFFKENGVEKSGRFRNAEVARQGNVTDLTTLSYTTNIIVDSLEINELFRRPILLSKPWFYKQKHPKIKLTVNNFQDLGGGQAVATGVLVIKDKAMDVSIPVQFSEISGVKFVTGSFSFDRGYMNLGGGMAEMITTIGESITVSFELAENC